MALHRYLLKLASYAGSDPHAQGAYPDVEAMVTAVVDPRISTGVAARHAMIVSES